MNFPLAATAIDDFYMDDILTGSNDFNEALKLRDELIGMFTSAKMKLRKWCSNTKELLVGLPEEDIEKCAKLEEQDMNETIKTLGVLWNPNKDSFAARVSDIENVSKITKRIILAGVAKLFDPLGFISPIVVTAKLMLQSVWQLSLDWDKVVPEKLATKWSEFQRELCTIKSLEIQRRIICDNYSRIELHGFADASERAYGAVVYIRCIS